MAAFRRNICWLHVYILLNLLGILLAQPQFFNRRSSWRGGQGQMSRSPWGNPSRRQIGTATVGRFAGTPAQRAPVFGRQARQIIDPRIPSGRRSRFTVSRHNDNFGLQSSGRQLYPEQRWRTRASVGQIPGSIRRADRFVTQRRSQIPHRSFIGPTGFSQGGIRSRPASQRNPLAATGHIRRSEVQQAPVTVHRIVPVGTQPIHVATTRIQPQPSRSGVVHYTTNTHIPQSNRRHIPRPITHITMVPLRRGAIRSSITHTSSRSASTPIIQISTHRRDTSNPRRDNSGISVVVKSEPKPQIATPVVTVKSPTIHTVSSPKIEDSDPVLTDYFHKLLSGQSSADVSQITDYIVNALSGKPGQPSALTTRTRDEEQLTNYFVQVFSNNPSMAALSKTEQGKLTNHFVKLLSNQQVAPQVPHIPVATQPFPAAHGLPGSHIFHGGFNTYLPGHMYPAYIQEMMFGDSVDPPDPPAATPTTAAVAATNIPSNATIADVVTTKLVKQTIAESAAKVKVLVDESASTATVDLVAKVSAVDVKIIPDAVVPNVQAVVISKDVPVIAETTIPVESISVVAIKPILGDASSSSLLTDKVIISPDTLADSAITPIVLDKVIVVDTGVVVDKTVDILDKIVADKVTVVDAGVVVVKTVDVLDKIVADTTGYSLPAGLVTNLAPAIVVDTPIVSDIKAVLSGSLDTGKTEEVVLGTESLQGSTVPDAVIVHAVPVVVDASSTSLLPDEVAVLGKVSIQGAIVSDTVIVPSINVDKGTINVEPMSVVTQGIHDALVSELTKLLVTSQIDQQSATSLLDKIKPNVQTDIDVKAAVIVDGTSHIGAPTVHVEPLPTAEQLGIVIPGIIAPMSKVDTIPFTAVKRSIILGDKSVDISLKPTMASAVHPSLKALLAKEAGIEVPKLANVIESGTKVEKIISDPIAVSHYSVVPNEEAKNIVVTNTKTDTILKLKSLTPNVVSPLSFAENTVVLLEQLKNTSGVSVLMKDPQFRNTLQEMLKVAMKEMNKALPTSKESKTTL